MAVDNLEWLDGWYQQQCNGEWEHSHGMLLEALEQRGWQLTISLTGTSAENAAPQKISLDSTTGDWIACSISPERFEGAGDPRKLEQIIGVFRQWVDAPGRDEGLPDLKMGSRSL
ncbi:MAG: immunity 53 family protein [Acidobacteriaceae bacterium]